ncbi:hypothetical protein ACIA47_16340 [Micromonospora sp. NPDC051227]|uniref:hypothetical protein n=1 Tax=Micromonospora sp. NPDC051227 TaxID=3364285 RepID=UPI0019344860|nr:hypothetical protein [Micromonospora sp. STR1s_5]
MATGTWQGQRASELLRGWLARNTDRTLVADTIHHDPWSAAGIQVMNKTGTDTGAISRRERPGWRVRPG